MTTKETKDQTCWFFKILFTQKNTGSIYVCLKNSINLHEDSSM